MQLGKLTVLATISALSFIFVTHVNAQPWEFDITDNSMSILLADAVLDDESLVEGDWVGVFTDEGVCGGASEIVEGFPDQQVGIAAWAAEGGEGNGFGRDDVINFRYWESEAEMEWDAFANVLNGNEDDDGNLIYRGDFARITLSGNRADPEPEINIDADIINNGHDFGALRINQSIDWMFEIGNDGGAQLVILDIVVDGDYFSVEFNDEIGIDDEPYEVTITFAPEETGEFEGTVTITWNDPAGGDPIVLSLMGVGEPLRPPMIVLDPNQIDFRDVIIDESRVGAFDITNTGDETLTISNISIENEAFVVDFGDDIDLALGESVEIIVTFTPTAEEEYSGEVNITSNDPDNGDVIVELTGVGVVDAPPQIGVEGGFAEFFFGYVITGEQRTWRMSLINEGVDDLHVFSMETDNDVFSFDFENEIRIRNGDHFFIDVTFAPEEDGLYEGVLTITSDDPDNDGEFEVLLGGHADEDNGNHFQVAVTANNHSLVIFEITLDGEALVEGDEIGLFTQRGLLAGAAEVMDDGRAGPAAWGDDPDTDIIDGFVDDEEFRFLVWDADADIEAWGVAEFLDDEEPQVYVTNGITTLNIAAETGEAAGQISLDEIRHFFGEVAIEDDFREWTFTIENVGLGELVITSVESDMNEYTTDFSDQEVVLDPEGGSIDVTVVFEPIEIQRHEGRLTISSSDPRNDVVYVDLIGDGVGEARNPGMRLNQPNWFFGVIPVGVERTFDLIITSSGEADLELQGLSFEGDDAFSADFPDQNPLLEPGESFELSITFQPDEEREFSGEFTIESNLIDEGDVAFPVSGFGRVSDDHFMHFDTGVNHMLIVTSAAIITAQDNRVPLYPGDEIAVLTPLGLVAGHIVIDEDNQNGDLAFPAYADDPNNNVLVGFQADEEFAFKFWDMSTESEIDCDVEFIEGPEVFDADAETELNLTADAAEEEPLLVVEPLVLQFPPTLIDDTSEDIFTLSNIGGENLIIEGYISDGDEFVLDLENEIVLEPGESVEISATFTPSRAIGYEGDVEIISNDPHFPSYMIHPVGMGSDHPGQFLFGRAGDNQSVFIRMDGGIGGVDPSAGDEVGVFTTDGMCAGASIYEPEEGEDAVIGLAAWGDETDTHLIEGFTDGERMTFKFYDASQDREHEPEIELERGSLNWEHNAFTTIRITVPNVISIIQVDPIQVDESEMVEFELTMSVDEGEWEFTWTNEDDFDNIPDGVFTVEDNVGAFSWQTTFDDAGEYEFEFSATDGDLVERTTVQVTVININRAPEVNQELLDGLLNDENELVFNEDEIQNFTLILLFEELFSDPDGDDMLFSRAPAVPPEGFEHRIEIDEDDGTHRYELRADQDWIGEVEVTLSANDGNRRDGRDNDSRQVRNVSGRIPERDDVTDVVFTVVVFNINDAPIFTAPEDADNDGQADEDVVEPEMQEFVIQFAATDEEDEGADLTFDISDRGGLPDEGPVFDDVGDGTATFTWTPNFDDAGEYNPTFRVTDNDEDPRTDEIMVSITITNVNQDPIVENEIPDLTGDNAIMEDADRVDVANLTNVFLDPDDGDGEGLVFEIRESPDELQVLISEDQQVLSIQPMENFHTVNEEGGMDELLISISATDGEAVVVEEFMVSVSSVNDAPMNFSMLSPEDGHSVEYDPDSLGRLDFSWEEALQVELELDTVRYIVQFWAEGEEVDTLESFPLELTNYDGISIDTIALVLLGGEGRRDEDLVVFWQVKAISADTLLAANAAFSFTIPALGVDPEDRVGIPVEYFMSPAYPNPFNMETTVKFGIPQPGMVSITVWDMHGRQVADILNSQLNVGRFSVVWNANGLTSGIYIIRMRSGSFTKLQKAVLVR